MDVVCDFETSSHCDLKKCGAARYAQDPTTEILCLVWEANGALDWWSPYLDNPGAVDRLVALVNEPQATFVSHASFEQFIWRYIMECIGFPPLPVDRWHDTQAVAAWRGHPLKLELLAKTIELPVQKDMEGSKLTIGLSKPLTKAAWALRHDPAAGTMADWMRAFPTGMLDRTEPTLRRVLEYCKTDVRTESAAHKKLGRLSRGEEMVWHLDQEINHRGVRIDLEFVRQAQRVIERAKVPLEEEFRDLTGGVGSGQREKIIGWCAVNGLVLENLQKDYLAKLLDAEEEDEESDAGTDEDVLGQRHEELPAIPQRVRRVLDIRQMLGSASIRKLDRMLACTGYDGRARGLTQYHAGITGRWGGRLLQPHNFPWDKEGVLGKINPEIAVDAILTGDPGYVEMMLGVPAITAVALSLRHALIADPGKVFLVGDFSGIEARIVLALAGQHDKTALMAAGHDVYLDMACDIYGDPRGSLTKENAPGKRDIGKKTVLGAGFQMGANKFHDRYCPDQPIEFAERTIAAYRRVWAPEVPELWYALERAAVMCAKTGEESIVRGCRIARSGQFLAIDLPSGWQRLWYFKPEWHRHDTRFGFADSKPMWTYLAAKHGTTQRINMYGGLLTENVVQALARGLLCTAMGRLTQASMPLVMTVHDEAICEVDEDRADMVRFKKIMEQPTEWSEKMGVPIAVDAWTGERYRK